MEGGAGGTPVLPASFRRQAGLPQEEWRRFLRVWLQGCLDRSPPGTQLGGSGVCVGGLVGNAVCTGHLPGPRGSVPVLQGLFAGEGERDSRHCVNRLCKGLGFLTPSPALQTHAMNWRAYQTPSGS